VKANAALQMLKCGRALNTDDQCVEQEMKLIYRVLGEDVEFDKAWMRQEWETFGLGQVEY
jgi:hypothetical protein